MNKEWLDEIKYCDFKEKEELEQWCKFIGYDRYFSIYNLLSKKINEKLSFNTLKAVAKYEFNLSDYLHSIIKFLELRFRAFLLNQYDFEITKHNYITQISAIIGENKRELDSKTHYEYGLNETASFSDFIEKSGMDTLFKIVKILSDDKLEKLNLNKKGLDKVLDDIKTLRNDVAHSHLLLLENKAKLKRTIILVLKCLPNLELKKKRIDKLTEINKNFKNELLVNNGIVKEIEIILNEEDKKEIGL